MSESGACLDTTLVRKVWVKDHGQVLDVGSTAAIQVFDANSIDSNTAYGRVVPDGFPGCRFEPIRFLNRAGVSQSRRGIAGGSIEDSVSDCVKRGDSELQVRSEE